MKRIIVDTDIGTDVDDALALTLALASPEIQFAGITTVHGNAPLRARIAQRLLQLAGREDIPVVAGASHPLHPPLPPDFHWKPLLGHEGVGILSADEIASCSGLDQETVTNEAAHFIIAEAAAHPGELSLVTIGALTNVARALQIEPRLRTWVRDITLMGGMVDDRNWHFPPMFEVNLNTDPQATQLVFASGIPLTLVPIEVTTEVFISETQRNTMAQWNHPLANTLVDLMKHMLVHFADFSQEMGLETDFYQNRTYLHDPLAIYTCMTRSLVTCVPMNVQIEIHNQVLRTIPHSDKEPNMQVCVGVQASAFVEFWLQRVKDFTSHVFTAGEPFHS